MRSVLIDQGPICLRRSAMACDLVSVVICSDRLRVKFATKINHAERSLPSDAIVSGKAVDGHKVVHP